MEDTTSFAKGLDYLKLPKDPHVWLIEDLVPTNGLVNIYASPKLGKAQDINTPILTPSGWKILKDIDVGDYVFSELGKPVKVTAVSPIHKNRTCYRVTFINGDSIVADGEHLWEVVERGGKDCEYSRKVLTTKELLDTGLTTKSGKYSKYMYCVDIPKALEFPKAKEKLPIDPYILGVWLGDGTSLAGAITSADPEIIDYFRKFYTVTKYVDKYGYGIIGFKAQLRDLGVLGNKHIPKQYLHASIKDRKALLAGLLDTDGTCAKRGNIEFYNMNETLAKDFIFLARGLGMRVVVSQKRAMLKDKFCGMCWRIRVSGDFNPFRLKRKAARVSWINTKELRWSIKSIVEVPSVPVKCIVVDNPTHLFLTGESLTVTHNSFAALGMAIAINDPNITSYLGFPVLKHGTVAYIQQDTPRTFWLSRIEKIVKESNVNIDNIYFSDRLMAPKGFSITNPESYQWFATEIKKAKPICVIIDTLRELHDQDEDNATAMKKVISVITDCIDDSAIIFISHSRKTFQTTSAEDIGNIMEDSRGSGYISGRMDCVMKMTKKVFAFQSRAGKGEFAIQQRPNTGEIRRLLNDKALIEFIKYLIERNPEFTQEQYIKIILETVDISPELALRKYLSVKEERGEDPQNKPEVPKPPPSPDLERALKALKNLDLSE